MRRPAPPRRRSRRASLRSTLAGWPDSPPARRDRAGGRGRGQSALGVDGDHPTPEAGGAGIVERQTRHARPNRARSRRGGLDDRHRDPAGQVIVWAWRSMRNWSLARPPTRAVGSVLTIGVSPGGPARPGWRRRHRRGRRRPPLGGRPALAWTRSSSSLAPPPRRRSPPSDLGGEMTSLSGSTATWGL